MDCEKFDSHVIDALYDELDELTFAALKRHTEGCSRCAGIYSGLRATREVGILPIEEPSADLEDKILTAAFAAQKKTAWHRKVLRGLAWAGSHAMRPQLAMAALFFLVIGSSLLLLRAKPGQRATAMRVTEHGAPAADDGPAAAAAPTAVAQATALPASPADNAGAEAPAEASRGRALAKAGDGEEQAESRREAKDAELEKAKQKGDGADPAHEALADARATRDQSGCAAAVAKLDQVGAKFQGTSAAADAMWEAAACYKSMGDTAKAHQLWLALKGSDGYKDRAQGELAAESAAALNNSNQSPGQQAVAAAPVARAAPPAPPPTTTAAPSASDGKVPATTGTRAVAAPKKAAKPTEMDSAYAIPPDPPASE